MKNTKRPIFTMACLLFITAFYVFWVATEEKPSKSKAAVMTLTKGIEDYYEKNKQLPSNQEFQKIITHEIKEIFSRNNIKVKYSSNGIADKNKFLWSLIIWDKPKNILWMQRINQSNKKLITTVTRTSKPENYLTIDHFF